MDGALKRRLESRFAGELTGPVRQRHDETEIRIGPGDVTNVCRALHDEADFRFVILADLAGVDTGTVMQVVYHLWSDTSADWLRVIADGLSRDDPRVPSVTFLWKGAEWMEREAEFYTLGEGEMFINMGPQHPSTHGVLRIVLKLDGEQVVDLDPVLGYLHRGVEKLCENADYHQTISQVDPLEYISSLFMEWSPVMAYEKLLDVQVPKRAEYIRVLSSELNRILSHSLFMGWMALDLGGLTPILWSFIERDEIAEMLASLTGQRLLFNYFRIGGVNGDLNHDFMSRLGDWMSRATTQIEANLGLLNENEIFVRRMRGLGTIDRETALRMCMTGPNLRATGIPFDVRRAHPYSVFPELEFDIPTRDEGDCLARYLVRMDEIKQSLRIIDQCLHNMPDGPVLAKLPRLLRPRPGRAYAAIEAPRGQYGVYAISDGTDQPFRLRIHDPSFIHLQSVGVLMPGHLIADAMAVMASLDPIMGGVDK